MTVSVQSNVFPAFAATPSGQLTVSTWLPLAATDLRIALSAFAGSIWVVPQALRPIAARSETAPSTAGLAPRPRVTPTAVLVRPIHIDIALSFGGDAVLASLGARELSI